MDDDLWALIEPLLLPPWPKKAPGPRPVPDQLCLQGILHVLHNNIAWQLLPPELRFASGQTCRRRLARDYEERPDSAEAMIWWSMGMVMSRRLARP